MLQTKSKESEGAGRRTAEAIYDGRQRCGDRKQTGVAEGGQKGIDGGVVTSSLDLGLGGGTERCF